MPRASTDARTLLLLGPVLRRGRLWGRRIRNANVRGSFVVGIVLTPPFLPFQIPRTKKKPVARQGLPRECGRKGKEDYRLNLLPVNLAACKRLLVLMGPSFLSRLWCVWEVFSIFAFSNRAIAYESVHVLSLYSDPDWVAKLPDEGSISIDDAHCFDPNEELKLRAILFDIGMERVEHELRMFVRGLKRGRSGTTPSQTLRGERVSVRSKRD
jgi:hypothetical protein